MTEAIRFLVTGRVQGVYFRANTQAQARALGLTGWVHNLADGQVEGVACGDPKALDELKAWLAVGPEKAQVTRLEVQPEEVWNGLGFEIR